ncbi:hypothetical protein MSIMFI_00033 [Mycobacterium simulans]|nr:hypothetical protein MSIMFI_00033 [Mycobacterium simulans]
MVGHPSEQGMRMTRISAYAVALTSSREIYC